MISPNRVGERYTWTTYLLEVVGWRVIVKFGLQAFVNEMRDAHIRVQLDNTTAVAYINNF